VEKEVLVQMPRRSEVLGNVKVVARDAKTCIILEEELPED
jgi:hypothetical protein